MNILFSLIFIIVGIYFIYSTYKKPSPMYSSDMKGYFGGIGFLFLGISSLLGKFDLYIVIKDIFNIK